MSWVNEPSLPSPQLMSSTPVLTITLPPFPPSVAEVNCSASPPDTYTMTFTAVLVTPPCCANDTGTKSRHEKATPRNVTCFIFIKANFLMIIEISADAGDYATIRRRRFVDGRRSSVEKSDTRGQGNHLSPDVGGIEGQTFPVREAQTTCRRFDLTPTSHAVSGP